MKSLEVVRADYYSNGSITPVAIKIEGNNSKSINKILNCTTDFTTEGNKVITFKCLIDNEEISIQYIKGKWLII